jgi:hypothetical protein
MGLRYWQTLLSTSLEVRGLDDAVGALLTEIKKGSRSHPFLTACSLNQPPSFLRSACTVRN